jgi:hypothetical protein
VASSVVHASALSGESAERETEDQCGCVGYTQVDMTKKEAQDFCERMKMLDTSEIELRLSTSERRISQLDQIWLMAQTMGKLSPKPLDLTTHDLWARLHRTRMGSAG